MDGMKKVPVREQEPKVRATNFEEVCYGYNEEEAVAEASRCLNCKNARCVQGCPVKIDIPAFVKEVNVLVTFNEKNDVEDYVSGEFGGILAPPSIQNAERLLNPAWCRPFVQVALEAIQYPTAYKFAVYCNDPHGDYSSFSGMYCGTRRFVIDELTVFIWNYGYLFK